MSSNRFVRAAVIAVGVAAAAVFVGTTLSANKEHSNHTQHMKGPKAAAVPSMPGQEVFGTIQEIVRILEADPTTDWSKVNIAALREHLIDMDEVTMRAAASERALDNGVEIAVMGDGRTLDAIKRMLPAHARELTAIGWDARTEVIQIDIILLVTRFSW